MYCIHVSFHAKEFLPLFFFLCFFLAPFLSHYVWSKEKEFYKGSLPPTISFLPSQIVAQLFQKMKVFCSTTHKLTLCWTALCPEQICIYVYAYDVYEYIYIYMSIYVCIYICMCVCVTHLCCVNGWRRPCSMLQPSSLALQPPSLALAAIYIGNALFFQFGTEKRAF